VGESTIRDRASREGWRRVDQPPPCGPEEYDERAEAEPMRPVVAVIADAYRYADLAMRRGKPVEAQRFLAVAKGFERLNRADPLVRALEVYWAKEEQLLLDTERFRQQWDAAANAAPLSPEPPDPPNPPNPPSDDELTEEAELSERSACVEHGPNPPNPPSVSEQPPGEPIEEAVLAEASASPPSIPDRIAGLEAAIARRRAQRLPFHDLVREISRLATSKSPGESAPPPQAPPALLTRPCHDPRHR
jgi:hypothetical protein